MDNLQITAICGRDIHVSIRFDERDQKWVATRSRDGAQSPPYGCLRTLGEDLQEAGHLEHFWGEPLLRRRVVRFDLDALVERTRAA
ncbi:hypothetical protein [Botrimarina mediterranea]|uniref:hypothetical protein n=1 Tax=Botrimarina mediterranea TaxID=2528022 RepID=UPI001189CAFF|nr:hypothetical protein K2D_29920 [Planctomycetes bacterium K2D]